MRHAISLAILTSVALLPFGAGAQQPAQQTADDKVLAEFIVTASKREQTLQNVPFSVAAQPKSRSATPAATTSSIWLAT
jgi:outer membrane receptor protein involved in Fe transport